MSATKIASCSLNNVPAHDRLVYLVAYTLGRVRTDTGHSPEVEWECFARELVVLQSDVPCSSYPAGT